MNIFSRLYTVLTSVAVVCSMSLALGAEVEEGKPVTIKFTAVDGTPVDLAKLHGKVVLVDFWATWCPPCRVLAPDIGALYKKYHSQGLDVVGISVDSDKQALLDFVKKEGAPWPQFFDGAGSDNPIAAQYGVDSFPTLWLIGKDGNVANANFRNLWVTDDGIPKTTSNATHAKIDAAIEKELNKP